MNPKLPKHTLKEIPYSQIQEFLKGVPKNISGVTEYTRDYISMILDEEQKQQFSHENWELFYNYTQNLYSFLPKIQKYRSGSLSLQLVEKMVRVFGELSDIEFEQLCDNENVRYVIEYAKEQNLENMIGICKTPAEFEQLCEKKNVRYVIGYAKEQNLENMIGICKTPAEFEQLYEKKNVRYVIGYAKEKNLENMIGICKTPAEFEQLCEKGNVRNVLKYAKEQNLEKVWNLEKIQKPAEFEQLCDNENVRKLLLGSEFTKSFGELCTSQEIQREDLQIFLQQFVWNSKDAQRIFLYNNIPASHQYENIVRYFLQHKKKSLLSFVQKVDLSYEFGLGIDITKLDTIDIYKDEDGNMQKEKVVSSYEKLCKKIGREDAKERSQLENALNSNDEKRIQKILAHLMIEIFNILYHKKWKHKMKQELQVQEEIDESVFDNPLFIEAYKMSINPRHNKTQTQQFLREFLTGKFVNPTELRQYDTEKNKNWLEKNLSTKQQHIWLEENIQEISLSQEIDSNAEHDNGENNIQDRIQHHFKIACSNIRKINGLGFEFTEVFKNAGALQKYFHTTVKVQEEEIRNKQGTDNLYDDLKLQIEEIQKLKHHKTDIPEKKRNMITISREQDPLKCMMMGNRVEGSCLSFYNTVGNYWSNIANTIDVNKGVYYIRDENGILLGRCLLTIGSDKKLSRYAMYYSKTTSFPLDTYFDTYTKKLAEKLGLELNGDQDRVENIECDKWYTDGVERIGL